MNKKFINILKKHENDDFLVTASEDKIKQKLMEEFVNADEILEIAKKYNYECKDFFILDNFPQDWTVVPIRTNKFFDIRKLTTSQRPYFHKHDFYEMIYVYRGQSSQIFRNPDGSLVLESGKICLLRPEVIHAVNSCGKNDIVLKIYIPQDLYKECFDSLLEWKENEYYKIFDTDEFVEFIIFKLLEEKYYRQALGQFAIKNYLSLLLIELLRTPDTIDSELKNHIIKYLNNNIKEASLHGFAEYMGYSTGYIGRRIKKNIGRSFTDIIGQYRLKCAGEILESSDKSIDDIAYEVGYANASGLYKQFCGYYGMTPNAYRKMFK